MFKNRKIKRLISIVLTSILVLGILTGCDKGSGGGSTSGSGVKIYYTTPVLGGIYGGVCVRTLKLASDTPSV